MKGSQLNAKLRDLVWWFNREIDRIQGEANAKLESSLDGFNE